MNFANYQFLCAAMGAAHKEGHNLEEDWELLDSSIQALIGSFSAGSYFNVQQIIRGSSNLELNEASRWSVIQTRQPRRRPPTSLLK